MQSCIARMKCVTISCCKVRERDLKKKISVKQFSSFDFIRYFTYQIQIFNLEIENEFDVFFMQILQMIFLIFYL